MLIDVLLYVSFSLFFLNTDSGESELYIYIYAVKMSLSVSDKEKMFFFLFNNWHSNFKQRSSLGERDHNRNYVYVKCTQMKSI
jgi:hypothetical protein